MSNDGVKSILFLYTELAEYTLACLEELAKTGHSIYVVRWPINSEAPFQFRALENVTFYERHGYSTSELIQLSKSIDPKLIICSGWVDKGYLEVCKAYNHQCPTVLTLDNHWHGDLLQRVKTLIAKQYFKKIFSHAWVPGEPQLPFVNHLGFKDNHTYTGFYSADLNLFLSPPRTRVSKKFLFVGRYLEFKGIFELWKAFTALKSESTTTWELHCAGHGDLWEQRIQADGIIHHGFLQPQELKQLVSECDVFILPSHKEPWGVVVHEMAASGLALLCSDQIGAATAFLEEGKNGFEFKSQSKSDLLEAMKKITALSEEELLQMSHHSQQLAKKISPATWANTAMEIMRS